MCFLIHILWVFSSSLSSSPLILYLFSSTSSSSSTPSSFTLNPSPSLSLSSYLSCTILSFNLSHLPSLLLSPLLLRLFSFNPAWPHKRHQSVGTFYYFSHPSHPQHRGWEKDAVPRAPADKQQPSSTFCENSRTSNVLKQNTTYSIRGA